MAAVLGVAGGALGGCTDVEPAIIQSSIRADNPRLDKEIQDWLEKLSPEDRAIIEKEIRWRKDLLIHVMEADLPPHESRGGASSLASSGFSKQRCQHHPKADGVPWKRDWNVFFDRRLSEKWTQENGIRSPPDTHFHHEICGHILLMLRNPEYIDFIIEKNKEVEEGATREVKEKAKEELRKFKEDFEKEILKIENEYRRHNELEEVPEYLQEPTKP